LHDILILIHSKDTIELRCEDEDVYS
jgi:hypothetical protein